MVTNCLFAPKNWKPSSITSWPLQTKSRSCCFTKSSSYLLPNRCPQPRGFGFHLCTSSLGSFQSSSATRPLSGKSIGFGSSSIYLKLVISREIPPCMHIIFSFIRATTGMWLKQLQKALHNASLYLLFISS